MNTFVPAASNDISAEIALVIFSMFIYVADAEKDISAQEVRRFQTLLKENGWMDNPELQIAIEKIKDHYSSFWQAYESGKVNVDKATISSILAKVGGALGEKRDEKLRRDLIVLLERVEVGVYGLKLLGNEQKAKTAARDELLKIVAERARRPMAQSSGRTRPVGAVVSVRSGNTSPGPSMPGLTGNIWLSGKLKVRCVSVIRETHDTKTFNFAADPECLFHYKPGQFVTIEIPLPDKVLKRSYTISSSPSRPHMLSITVKKVPMGWMSNWLHDNMTEGMECMISGPTGKFTFADHTPGKVLFLSAGSGITPCMSMLRWLADTPSTTDIVFINYVRTPDDIIFHQELLHLSTRLGSRLRLAIVPGDLTGGHPWHGPSGKLDEAAIRSYAPDFTTREVFTCGPAGFMELAKSMLAAMGLPADQFHSESFGTAPVLASRAQTASFTRVQVAPNRSIPLTPQKSLPGPGVTATLPSSSPAFIGGAKPSLPITPSMSSLLPHVVVRIRDTDYSFHAQPGQTILEAAEASGVSLEHSCRSGTCGSCKMSVVSGSVDMSNEHALTSQEIADGYILTCIGKPKGNLTLSS